MSSGNLSLTVYLAQLDPNTLNIASFEPLAGGFSIQVPVTNSSPAAGTLGSSSLTFNGNDMSKDDRVHAQGSRGHHYHRFNRTDEFHGIHATTIGTDNC